ncbi:MAG: HypC/HybG/HupF family hydrogenase formation chaperone, partial [Geodermatophilaceae bacterium]|nr:HypC/HybG/HupF family hydrogenase formation chaperone [Geodermatophilaceae bacterium]
VCFEHPGLLSPPVAECTDEVCVTCSDEGRLAEVILAPSTPFGDALVRTEAGEEWIDVTMVAPVTPGDLVLIHAGTALTRLDPEMGR